MSLKSERRNRRKLEHKRLNERREKLLRREKWQEFASIISMDPEDQTEAEKKRAAELEAEFRANGEWSESNLRAVL